MIIIVVVIKIITVHGVEIKINKIIIIENITTIGIITSNLCIL
jgi:hypothetical protein